MRRQYLEQKARQPDAILFFRLGDFYETFDDDAKLVAAELGITLTSKPMGGGLRAPLAGVPVAHVESHLARLVARGHRVAICEQLEDPRAARGLVRRGVVRVLSPGTALEPALLEAGEPSACAALTLQREPTRGGGAPGGGAGCWGWPRWTSAPAPVTRSSCAPRRCPSWPRRWPPSWPGWACASCCSVRGSASSAGRWSAPSWMGCRCGARGRIGAIGRPGWRRAVSAPRRRAAR